MGFSHSGSRCHGSKSWRRCLGLISIAALRSGCLADRDLLHSIYRSCSNCLRALIDRQPDPVGSEMIKVVGESLGKAAVYATLRVLFCYIVLQAEHGSQEETRI